LVLQENITTSTNLKIKDYHRLLFMKRENNTYDISYIQVFTADSTYNNLDKKFNYYSIKDDFNGSIYVLDGMAKSGTSLKFKKGKKIIPNFTAKESDQAEVNCLYLGWWYEDGSFSPIIELGCFGGGGGDEYLGNTTGGNTTGGYGGSGNGSSTTNLEVEITLIGPKIEIADIKNYLNCFNLSQSAELIIYVDQPTANSPTPWSGTITDPNVGHTFVAIQQGNLRRVFGYYPNTTVSLSTPNDPKAFGNDQGHAFDVSLSIPINSGQLLNVIDYANNAPSTYNLNTYNCTDFAIEIGNLVGLGLPDSYGTWPGGGGSNPGQLGQNIRNMALPTNTSRQTTRANAANNTGTCN
jgi:hypothetical protein